MKPNKDYIAKSMKYFYFILFLFVGISSSFGQINIGKTRGVGNLWAKEHKKTTFESIKKQKTLFVLPKMLNKEELQSTIESVWTFNELTFIDESVYEANKGTPFATDYMFIRLLDFEYIEKENNIEKGEPWKKTYFLVGSMNNVKAKENEELDYDFLEIAEIYLKPSIINLDQENEIYSIRLPLVKNYFQELNRRLEDSQSLIMIDGIEKEEKLKSLAEKTLFVPWAPSPILKCDSAKYHLEFIPEETGGHSGFITKEEQLEFLSEVFESYNFKYEIITQEKLDEKILKEEGFYYINNTQYKYFNIMSISNGSSGEIIYLDLKKATWRLKSSRVKDISKAISKSL